MNCWMSQGYIANQIIYQIIYVNSNTCQFAYDISKYILHNENYCILIYISMKYVPKAPSDNIAALVQGITTCMVH